MLCLVYMEVSWYVTYFIWSTSFHATNESRTIFGKSDKLNNVYVCTRHVGLLCTMKNSVD